MARKKKKVSAATRAAEPQRLDRAGRLGWLMPDRSILWDDGEKEVPVSGLSDNDKRAQARAEAEGEQALPTAESSSLAEIARVERLAAQLAEPDRRLAERRMAAKEAASRKPGAQGEGITPDMPPSQAEIEGDVRLQAKKLLDREIDRLEELKTMAIAGRISLEKDGIPVSRGNPPMVLHEAILAAIRTVDSGDPAAMLRTLHAIRGWQAWTGRAATIPNPPPDGMGGPHVLPPATSTGQANPGTGAVQDGGKSAVEPVTPPAVE